MEFNQLFNVWVFVTLLACIAIFAVQKYDNDFFGVLATTMVFIWFVTVVELHKKLESLQEKSIKN